MLKKATDAAELADLHADLVWATVLDMSKETLSRATPVDVPIPRKRCRVKSRLLMWPEDHTPQLPRGSHNFANSAFYTSHSLLEVLGDGKMALFMKLCTPPTA